MKRKKLTTEELTNVPKDTETAIRSLIANLTMLETDKNNLVKILDSENLKEALKDLDNSNLFEKRLTLCLNICRFLKKRPYQI